jgi:hypothetical protein
VIFTPSEFPARGHLQPRPRDAEAPVGESESDAVTGRLLSVERCYA